MVKPAKCLVLLPWFLLYWSCEGFLPISPRVPLLYNQVYLPVSGPIIPTQTDGRLPRGNNPSIASPATSTALHLSILTDSFFGVGLPEVATTAMVGYLVLGKDELIRWTKRGGMIVGKVMSTLRITLQNVQAELKSPEQIAELERAQRELAMSLGLPPNTILDWIQKYQPPPGQSRIGTSGATNTAATAAASSGVANALSSSSNPVMNALGKLPLFNSPSQTAKETGADQHIVLSTNNITSLTADGSKNLKVFRRRRRRPKVSETTAAAAPKRSAGSGKTSNPINTAPAPLSRQASEVLVGNTTTATNITASDDASSVNATDTETSASSSSEWAQRRNERLSRLTQRLESDGPGTVGSGTTSGGSGSTSDSGGTEKSAASSDNDEWNRQRQARLERLQGSMDGSLSQQTPHQTVGSDGNAMQERANPAASPLASTASDSSTDSVASTTSPPQDTLSALQAQLAELDREREAEEARLQQEFQRREKMAQDYYISKKKLLEQATSTLGGGGTTGATTTTSTEAATKDSDSKDTATNNKT